MTGLVVSLAACSSANPDSASPDCEVPPAGSVSESVAVSGEFGEKPEVVFTSPTKTSTTERSVIIDSDGERAKVGDIVKVQYSLYNGGTGEELETSSYTEAGLTPFPIDIAQLPYSGIVDTLRCTTVGSRVVGVIPPSEGFGDLGLELGLGATDDLIFVVDLVEIEQPAGPALPKADGVDQPVEAGLPTVVLGADGRPTVTIPSGAPPAELGLAVLKLGSGAVVKAGDNVTVHYQGTNWNTGQIFDESWARGEPATFNTGQVIAGFTAALVGQTVGSQVLVVIPPDQGYGAAGKAPSIGGTDTLIFVVDILGIS
jgi:peptidylprolyl isomerase